MKIMKRINLKRYLFILLTVQLFFVMSLNAQSGGTFVIEKSVIANGGGQSSGGTFALTGTTGQTFAGSSSSGSSFNVRSGFWQNSSSSIVSVSGRVTTSGGRGVRNAMVNLTDPQNFTRQVLTGPFGAYRFDNVLPGQTYTVTVMARRFQFTMQMISVNDDLTGVDFIASP